MAIGVTKCTPRAYSPSMQFRLEALQPEDLPVARKWVKSYYDLDDLEFNDRVISGITTLLASPEWGHFWQIVRGEEAVGYIVLTFGFDHEFGGKLGVVTDFYLEEPARGGGLGTAVLTEVLARAKTLGCHHLELAVLDHNIQAERFYKRLGLSPQTGRRTFEIEL